MGCTETSGGAIFHTGSMRVSNTSFVANKAGVEGAGVMSVGLLEELSNVSFSENAYHCRFGEYGYLDKNEASTTNFHANAYSGDIWNVTERIEPPIS